MFPWCNLNFFPPLVPATRFPWLRNATTLSSLVVSSGRCIWTMRDFSQWYICVKCLVLLVGHVAHIVIIPGHHCRHGLEHHLILLIMTISPGIRSILERNRPTACFLWEALGSCSVHSNAISRVIVISQIVVIEQLLSITLFSSYNVCISYVNLPLQLLILLDFIFLF